MLPFPIKFKLFSSIHPCSSVSVNFIHHPVQSTFGKQKKKQQHLFDINVEIILPSFSPLGNQLICPCSMKNKNVIIHLNPVSVLLNDLFSVPQLDTGHTKKISSFSPLLQSFSMSVTNEWENLLPQSVSCCQWN